MSHRLSEASAEIGAARDELGQMRVRHHEIQTRAESLVNNETRMSSELKMLKDNNQQL